MTLWKDKDIYNLNNVTISLSVSENLVDFNMKKEREAAAKSGAAPQLTEEQKKELEQINKENLTVKDLNNMLAQARTAKDAGDTDTATAVIEKAIAMDANRDLLWYTKGDIQVVAAKKETDRAARKEKYAQATASYQKAIDLANASPDPKTKQLLGNYYEGQAKAFEGAGDVDKSAGSYGSAAKFFAAQTPPNTKQAAAEYFNMGAVYTNSNRSDEAIKAFDQAIQLDPEKADAYYWKGVALMGKGENKEGKYIVPPGTDDAFNKYLELSPEGSLAQPAKDMLAAIGSEVKTSYKAKKKK
jgi:tetratricopeptide (TPR) repeat protein